MHLALLLALTAGLTPSGRTIDVLRVPAALDSRPLVVVLGGLDGDEQSAKTVASAAQSYAAVSSRSRLFHLFAIPMANPDRASLAFPPKGTAYRENAESHYLWRWLAARAPDLVLVAGPDAGLGAALPGIPVRPFESLAAIPSSIPKSEARREQERRLARSPRETADQLALVYGLDLPQVVYIPAVAVIGRMRLGHVADAERLATPYHDGSRDSLAKLTGSHLSGHLLFAELAARTGNREYVAMVRKTADLGFTPDGGMRDSMPMHDEMSDSVFMGCPILAQAGKLTGETRYFDMAVRHFRFMKDRCLRPDGLFRHSPLNDAAWGRGNGFPALGLALTIEAMPERYPGRAELLDHFRRLAAALAPYQNEDGLWRQVIDREGVYPEFTATAMISTAMLRGIRNGWLDAKQYQPAVDRAWRAINARIASDGVLLDVCEGTGKQKTAGDYLRRGAIYGRDPRGGAMALLFATEMAGLK
jgi:unsaturated rhamnogalacturonyl hydrolase